MKPYRARLSKKSISVICCALMLLPAIAQEKHALSVKEAAAYAVKNSVYVKNALIDVQIQQQTNREITASAYPQLNGGIGINYFPQIPVQSFPNFIAAGTYGVLEQEKVKDGNGNPIVSPKDFGFIQAQFGTKFTGSAGIDLTQIIFDGQVMVGLQARTATMNFARKKAEVTEEQIKANVYKIYYQLVVGRKQLEAVDANIERIEKWLHNTRELFNQGFAEKLDVSKVDVTLTNLKTERLKIENQLQAGSLGLKMLMGMSFKEELVLTDTLSEAELKENILEANYSYTDRKEFQLLEIGQKLGDYNIKRYKLTRLPSVAAFGSYSKNAQRNKFNFFNFNEQWFTTALIGMKISVPIFDGYAKDARIKKAKLELQQVQNSYEDLKLAIDYEIEQSRINMRNAILSMDLQRKNMELALQVYNQTKLKYEQGLGSNLEITNAQTELKTAQTNYYSALYDAIVAKIDFQKASGKL